MPTKARAKMLHDTYEKKTRFKLYKKGHTWVIAGLTLLFTGVLATQQVQVTHADTTGGDTNTTSSTTGTDTTTAKTVILTPTTVATIGDQTMTVGGTEALPTVTMAEGEVAPDWTMSDFDFSKVDTTTAGTYTVSLSAAGLAKLQAANPSQTITASHAVSGTMTVQATEEKNDVTQNDTTSSTAVATETTQTPKTNNQVAAQAAITASVGNATKAYDGKTDNPATVTVTLSAGAIAPSDWYYTGTANTYKVNTTDGDLSMSTDGKPGTSTMTLSAQGIAALKAVNPDATVSAANVTAGTLTITQKSILAGSITIANQSKPHDGDLTTDPTTYNVTLPNGIVAPSTWTKNTDSTYALTTTAGDISVADDSSQKMGDYAVSLSARSLSALQAANPGLAITANTIAPATFTIESVGTISVGTTSISQTTNTLPATITVSVTNGLKVPDDWNWSYRGSNIIQYDIPLTADNFDLSKVQLNTIGSYDIAFSDSIKAQLQALNPDVVLTDDLYSNGKVFVIASATSQSKYAPSWLIADVKDMNFFWGQSDVGDMVVGEPYQLQVGLYSNGDAHSDPIYDGLTEYVILPSGFQVTEAAGSTILSSDPAQTIHDIITAGLAPAAAQGFKGVTVTQLADFEGRETFKVVLHTDGSNQGLDFSQSTEDLLSFYSTRGVFEIRIVVDGSVAGTRVPINSTADSMSANIVYITDDPAVTGDNYSLRLSGYENVPAVADALGILNANGLKNDTLGNPYYVNIVQADVVQTFNLVDTQGKAIGTATYQGTPGSTYTPSDVLPNTVNYKGVTYYLVAGQLADTATLTPGVGAQIDQSTMTVAATPINVLYCTVLPADSIEVGNNSKGYDNDPSNPAQYTVTLAAGLVAPSDWSRNGYTNTYFVSASSGDLDLSGIDQHAGNYTVTLTEAAIDKLAALNPTTLISRNAVTGGALNIVSTVTTDYEYPTGVDTSNLPAQEHQYFTSTGQTFTLSDSGSDFVIPTLKGYTATVTDSDGNSQVYTPGQELTFTTDGTNQTFTISYAENAPEFHMDTVTKTIMYVDNLDNKLQPDFVTHVNFTEIIDPVTGDASYGPESAKFDYQALPSFKGYYIYSYDPNADVAEEVAYGDPDVTYKVVYRKLIADTKTISKTVHYVDQDGNQIAPDYQVSVDLTQYTNPFNGEISYDQESAKLGYQANPTIAGYHVVTSPSEATSAQTVQYGDADETYTVVYNKDTPEFGMDTVTKTVHYVDQDGNALADDYTAYANFTEITDPVTGEKSYGPESATLGYRANPTIAGYHVVTSPTEATSAQTVQYGDTDEVYTVVYNKNTPEFDLDTVTKTVHYVDQDGNTIADDYSAHANFTEITDPVTGEKSFGPESATLGYQANPTIAGYHVVTSPSEATSAQTVQYGDADEVYTVVYNKNTPEFGMDTVTKTVHYVDQDGNTIAPDYTDHANFTEVTDPVTGEKSYGPESATLGYQANPTIAGYHVVTSPSEATSAQTVQYGNADEVYTIVYNKNTPAFGMDTVTKTVHYVDQDGNTIAPDYTDHANFTEVTDPVTGAKTYGPENATLSYQANPTIAGYHVVTSPREATSAQTVQYGDADEVYTVVYNKNTPEFGMGTVTKTVHYVDQDGNTIAPDYTDHANFTEVTDPVTGEKSYGPESATLGYQANPTIAGYHVVTSPTEATSAQTVQYGHANEVYTVVYNKNTPEFGMDTVTKTVHYVDQDGNTIAPDYTDHANFTEVTDPVTGEKTYGPESATLGYQANPTISGYHVVTNQTEATSAQSVQYGDTDEAYTVVYNKNTPEFGMDTVTKTVHYVDQDGNTIAPDYTDHENFTEITDPVTGEKSYGPESATLGYQDNPTIAGYHVVTNPSEATSAQTVQYGAADQTYTVVYNKDTPAFDMDTVTKTVHYVDQDGNTIAPDYTDQANFTEITDPVTGEKTYGPETATLGYQANPTISGYHVVTNPSEATSAQTVQYGDADEVYTVVYNKNTPEFSMNTVTKTVHYVDQDGNTIAPDYTDHANFTEVTDPVTSEKSYGPESATLGYQANPTIAGYHVVTSPSEATSAQTVQYGDADESYTVVYEKDTTVDNGGTTTPGDNAGTTTPGDNGGTTTPDDNGGTTTPGNNGDTTTPGDNGGTTTPGDNGGTTTPGNNGGTTTTQPRVTLPDTSVGDTAQPSGTSSSIANTDTTATTSNFDSAQGRASLPDTNGETTGRRQLPQTGDQASSFLALLGTALLGLLGAAESRRKRHEK